MRSTTKVRARTLGRRGFMCTVAGAAAALRGASEAAPAARRGIKLGFDNFSIRDFGWKAPRLIEYAAAQKVDTLLLSDLNVYESLDADYLGRIKAQAAAAGVELQAGTGSICPTSSAYGKDRLGPAEDHARLLIRTAKALGARVARCYLGTGNDRKGDGGIYRHIEAMVKTLKAVRAEAADANVRLAVENHAADMQAWELVMLIEEAGKDFVGATMDCGNAVYTMEDPMVNLEILGPYALTTGMRDTAVWETPRGARAMWANMGEGVTDWTAYADRFQELCPGAPFVLEILSYIWPRDLAYLETAMWKEFPRARAGEFARFVALAKRGREFTLTPGRPAGTQSKELTQAQQKFDLEHGLEYCRRVLGLGLK
ncbi:MAG TPA: sugar phosphate isomerase/epimerase [Planctomycetes bacterium]|nr:sugar phosphate isomerase/epimerase [Planctomycetota bacterium]